MAANGQFLVFFQVIFHHSIDHAILERFKKTKKHLRLGEYVKIKNYDSRPDHSF